MKRLWMSWCVAFLLICVNAVVCPGNIGVEPSYLELDLDEGRCSGVFMVSNVSDQEQRYRINAISFAISETGGIRQLSGKDIPYSLAPWIRFNPRELVLPARSQRAVRFAVIPRGQLEEGEYWGAMELESLQVNTLDVGDVRNGRALQLRALTALMVPIFGTVGKPVYSGQVNAVQAQRVKGTVVLGALLEATGTGRLGALAQYEIFNQAGDKVSAGILDKAYVMRGTRRWFTQPIEEDLELGSYHVKITVLANHLKGGLTYEAEVEWPPLLPEIVDPNQSQDQVVAPDLEPAQQEQVDPNALVAPQ